MARHPYFYEEEWRYMRFLVPPGRRILELGCGHGHLLNALDPSYGVGIDFSAAKIAGAKSRYPKLTFLCDDIESLKEAPELSEPFDIVIMSDTIGSLDDCLATFQNLHRYCKPETRLIVSYYTRLWNPLLLLYGKLAAGQRTVHRNWLSNQDIASLLQLADFDVIKREWRMLVPFRLLGLGRLLNRFFATLPLIRKFGMRNYVVARPWPKTHDKPLSASVVIPCRNERGNIEAAVQRLPRFCPDIEIVFVEGHSSDGTWEEVLRVQRAYPHIKIKAVQQAGKGKGDAVRRGFAEATGDVLMILDADLTMPPEDLPKYYDALTGGKGEFINGSRLVYPMESQAMQSLNYIANHLFALTFSFLLGQRYTDTLCGTKVLLRRDYDEIARNRSYFGEFDPFGDFDLIFGAARLNLKTAEVPIRYAARAYGETNISRFRHGLLLMRMVAFAFIKLKAL
jgi:SAM-dependent methyltransferase